MERVKNRNLMIFYKNEIGDEHTFVLTTHIKILNIWIQWNQAYY
jgi:hypothetical protein